MDDLIAFIRARLDEDERDARERRGVWPEPGVDEHANVWLHVHGNGNAVVVKYLPGEIDNGDTAALRGWTRPTGAGWSRGRVLREVEAKRKILDLHQPGMPIDMSDAGGFVVCVSCGPSGNDPGLYMFGEPASLYPCDTVRAFASAWSDHPDYREEWRPVG